MARRANCVRKRGTAISTKARTFGADSYADGVWFVGLASVAEPEQVASALAALFGITLPAGNPVSGLAAWLRDKRALAVLDNCEHVINAVARPCSELQ